MLPCLAWTRFPLLEDNRTFCCLSEGNDLCSFLFWTSLGRKLWFCNFWLTLGTLTRRRCWIFLRACLFLCLCSCCISWRLNIRLKVRWLKALSSIWGTNVTPPPQVLLNDVLSSFFPNKILEIAGGVGGRRELAEGDEARDEIRVELQRAALTLPKFLQRAL